MKRLRVLLLLILLTGCGDHAAKTTGSKGSSKSDEGSTWRHEANKRGIGEHGIELLAQNKILITNETYRQVFSPYVESDLPIFITSDSLLNAYNSLFEESLMNLEEANARQLAPILRYLWARLDKIDSQVKGKPEQVRAAKFRAQVVLGVALTLLGEDIETDQQLGATIQAEVIKVRAASEQSKPQWLGPPDPGFLAIDYTRFKPRGFYLRSARLENYFRALSWLQAIPFRLERDDEFLTMALIAMSGIHENFDYDMEHTIRDFIHGYQAFLGAGEDFDLSDAIEDVSSKQTYKPDEPVSFDLEHAKNRRLEKYQKHFHVNDQLRLPGRLEPCYRIISTYSSPEEFLFDTTTDPEEFKKRDFPSGLEVGAALGSEVAREELAKEDAEKVLKVVDENHNRLFDESWRSLYLQYFHALSSLVDDPNSDAPPLFAGRAWKIKSLQTTLAGWSQQRHAWVLQTRQNYMVGGFTEMPPGFVEPEPVFFNRMAELTEKAYQFLGAKGAFSVSKSPEPDDLKKAAEILDRLGNVADPEQAINDLTEQEEILLAQTIGFTKDNLSPADLKPEQLKKSSAAIKQKAEDIEDGTYQKSPWEKSREPDLQELWVRMTMLCRKLESISHKQLRGVPFNQSEEAFLKGYGKELAGLMLYNSNSYLSPHDDAPRIVSVFTNPNVAASHLQVGVARARAIYVLYPYQGKEVLCRGAVMPYYEFTHAERLTDEQWKELLDSDQRPDIPAWVKPIVWDEKSQGPNLTPGGFVDPY